MGDLSDFEADIIVDDAIGIEEEALLNRGGDDINTTVVAKKQED